MAMPGVGGAGQRRHCTVCGNGSRPIGTSLPDRDLFIVGAGRRRHPRPAPVGGRARRLEFVNRDAFAGSEHAALRAAAGRRISARRGRRRRSSRPTARPTRSCSCPPPEHVRRAQPAGDPPGRAVDRAAGERARELVAGAALERADPAHPGGRARALPRRSWTCASAPGSRAATTKWRCWRAISTRWPTNSRPTAARARGCCATFRTNCARRWRACASRWDWRASRRRIRRASSTGWNARSSGSTRLISQVLKLARLHGTDTRFAREAVDIDEIIKEVVHDANFEGAAKNCAIGLRARRGRDRARQPRTAAQRDRERAAQRGALQPGRRAGRGERRRAAAAALADLGRATGDRACPAERPGAHIRAVFPRRRVARPRQRRRRHRPRDHAQVHEGPRRHGRAPRIAPAAASKCASRCRRLAGGRALKLRADSQGVAREPVSQKPANTFRAGSIRRCARFAASAASRSSSRRPRARTSSLPTAAASSTTSAHGAR